MNMEIVYILSAIAILMLVVVVILSIVLKKKTSHNDLTEILTKTAKDQSDIIAKQVGDGTTEQFKRFGMISESIQSTLQGNRDETSKKLSEFQMQLDSRLSSMSRDNAANLEKVNETLENKMKALQESNEKRIEQMQGIVDEKLQKTLESKLSQSFELVSKQLDTVAQGLGEMRTLAADTKSLRNALTNVKERGTYGEVRLEKLLSDFLAPGQYEANVEIDDKKRVDFAVKFPGHGAEPLLVPIDAKFPIEDYNKLINAEDKEEIEEARKALAQRVKSFAKDISEKYIVPPKTTDFALMFLPTEGLYAEIVQNTALFEEMRLKYRIIPVGATTLSAYLDSLQLGFKTLAMEKRSLEVWDTLRAVKAEFAKFAEHIDRAQKQIQTADKTLTDIVGTRTNAINRKLRSVELAEGEQLQLAEKSEAIMVDECWATYNTEG